MKRCQVVCFKLKKFLFPTLTGRQHPREKPETNRKTEKKEVTGREAEWKDNEWERVQGKDTDAAEGGDTSLANPHCSDGTSEHLYDKIREEASEANDGNASYAESPPLPPRTKPAIPKQQQFLYTSPGVDL